MIPLRFNLLLVVNISCAGCTWARFPGFRPMMARVASHSSSRYIDHIPLPIGLRFAITNQHEVENSHLNYTLNIQRGAAIDRVAELFYLVIDVVAVRAQQRNAAVFRRVLHSP